MSTSYFFCDPASGTLNKLFGRLRHWDASKGEDVVNYPASVGGHKVASVRDVTLGTDSALPGGHSTLPQDKSAHMITFRFENGTTCTLRNSGTV